MNPEMAAIRSIDREREHGNEFTPHMERAYDKAREIFVRPEFSIQEEEFRGIYDAHTIADDIARARRIERTFEENNTAQQLNQKKTSEIFEAVMVTQAGIGQWLGRNASVLRTSRFDDYINNVDMIAEWSSPEDGSRMLALAVDVTFGERGIDKKMTEIRHEIDKGRLGSVRYFRDQKKNFMGTLMNVPRTVVGISQPVVNELATLWLDNKKKELAAHPMQRVVIDQISSQLLAMEKYALKLGRNDIALAYRNTHAALRTVREEKKFLSAGELIKDPVAVEIDQLTRHHFVH